MRVGSSRNYGQVGAADLQCMKRSSKTHFTFHSLEFEARYRGLMLTCPIIGAPVQSSPSQPVFSLNSVLRKSSLYFGRALYGRLTQPIYASWLDVLLSAFIIEKVSGQPTIIPFRRSSRDIFLLPRSLGVCDITRLFLLCSPNCSLAFTSQPRFGIYLAPARFALQHTRIQV